MKSHRLQLTTLQQRFADHLAGLWNSSDSATDGHLSADPQSSSNAFWHCYAITRHGAWRTWKRGGHVAWYALRRANDVHRASHWWCESLSEARSHFSWSEGQAPFAVVSRRLQDALKKRSALTVREACLEVFRWGGVARSPRDRSQLWVDAAFKSGSLIEGIEAAVSYLKACEKRTNPFEADGLLMNSAMTKVYAAADTTFQVIIYDGRVGAALGLLARCFLEERRVELVPDDLAFLWGPAQGKNPVNRNPSKGPLRFRSLYDKGIDNVRRAETARIATAILSRTRDRIIGKTPPMRDIEQSLFMIGYNVDSLPRSTV